MNPSPLCFLAGLLALHPLFGADAPFEIHDGDRVLFIGDTLIEREGTYGYLETRLHEQFPDRKFTVRNLGFAGDTPLGWSRASFDPPAKGWDRLKEQLALVRPTVAFIGYGMAASLQEITDRSGDRSLNPDPTRYGTQPMNAARFKGELAQLMDAIVESAPKPPGSATAPVRFVLLSPTRHEDLRQSKPGLPDPAHHNQLLDAYSKAVEELAKERGARFADLRVIRQPGEAGAVGLTTNGLHLTSIGYASLAARLAEQLQFGPLDSQSPLRRKFSAVAPYATWLTAFRAAVVRKNELFFHRWRPANSTYLFGFRKYEQGQNAVEIPKFDPLIEQAEAEIDRLKRAALQNEPAIASAESPAASENVQAAPVPQFTIQDGYQIELWAENPLLEKPTQMNWDAQGRLWICSSSLYPQIAPGEAAHDKILILEDTDHDGKADKSTVFADGLLIPTGVEPDLARRSKESRTDGSKLEARSANAQSVPPGATSASKPSTLDSRPSPFLAACYVGQSTELLHFEDTDGDGKADEKRIVLSGFGTEDTHHIIHALHWGQDGRLYFNQSVYIHSHLETPHGMVRLNSGGILAYDPRTERVEVFARGWWNSWGHQMDQWGQSFTTDGAGSTGVSWVIPGAVYPAYEGSRRIAPAISPGSYPKFCGLEMIYSPHFPADWQGNAITCDFRAHRIVRFGIEDLSLTGAQPVTDDAKSSEGRRESENRGRIPNTPPRGGSAGYTAKEMPDFIRTSDIAFRPIDIKLGPDGALYIADWSNPVINHGEVDFRDPRRDKHRGRIWRVTKKDAPLAKWEPLTAKRNEDLLEKLLSVNLWEKEQARRVFLSSDTEKAASTLLAWSRARGSKDDVRMATLPVLSVGNVAAINDADLQVGTIANPQLRAYAARAVGEINRGRGSEKGTGQKLALTERDIVSRLTLDENPRVRLEAIRALAQIPAARSAELVLNSLFAVEKNGADARPSSSLPETSAANKADASRSAVNSPPLVGQSESRPQIGDPFLEYAAWLSINELAKPWTDAIANGTWKTDGRDQQLAWGLTAIEPALATATISKLFAERKIPLDGSGSWFELLGKTGGPKELMPLYRGLLAGIVRDGDPVTRGAPGIDPQFQFPSPVSRRAAAALVEAARVRNVKPESPLTGGQLAHWPLVVYGQADALPDILRMVGYWRLDELAPFVASNAEPANSTAVHEAVFESLRQMGGKLALQTTESFLGGPAPDQSLLRSAVEKASPDIRRRALITLVSLDPKRATAHLSKVLGEVTSEADLLATWRELFKLKAFTDRGAGVIPKDLPRPAAVAGLRAARELGKKGEALVSALTPLAGLADTGGKAGQDFKSMVEFTKRDGDPARGELIYRRANLGCVVCHAIGGAGGKVGPELTSLGASAPLDYIIESTLNPAAKVKEGFNAVSYTMKDGSVVSGIQARETPQELVLRDVTGREQSVVKANIASKLNIGTIMPAGLVEQLPSREQLDLFAFLGELGKPGVYDASKGEVARVWTIYSSDDGERVRRGDLKNENSANAFTLVDGRLLKEQLVQTLQLVTNRTDAIIAVAQFQTAVAGKTRLKLTGATKGWLDGQPVVITPDFASELPAGPHQLAVSLDSKQLPEVLRAESADARFLGN